jgi:hypothetical protein
LKITLTCSPPNRQVGPKKEIVNLEELFNFLIALQGFPKQSIGSWLLSLAKNGSLSGTYFVQPTHFKVMLHSNYHDTAVAQRIAQETKLLSPPNSVSISPNVAKSFARAFDVHAIGQNVV